MAGAKGTRESRLPPGLKGKVGWSQETQTQTARTGSGQCEVSVQLTIAVRNRQVLGGLCVPCIAKTRQ